MTQQQPLLKMQGITKEYFGNRVLTDVSLDLNRGEVLGLVGENGAGKSTLMNILFGMSVIVQTGGYAGKVFIDGKEVSFQNPFDALKAGIGMVHQEFSLIPGFTATENILLNGEILHDNIVTKLFGPRLKTLDLPEMRAIAEKSIELLGVEISPDTLVAEMPVGHRQFTELAREIHRPEMKVLVLDEPTAVLTESEAEVLLTSLRRLAATGIAIIFITHRLQEILDICDRIVILRDGQVVKEIATHDTDIGQVAELMVGRSVDTKAIATATYDTQQETVLAVEHLWVDMPGETVRDVSFEVHKGEIFGIGGLAGQGKLGIPNGIMGLCPAGGTVILHGKPIHLEDPAAALAASMAFVSEDRRGVGLLMEEPLDWNIAFTAMQVQNKFLRPLLGGLIKWRDDRAIRKVTREYIEALEIKCTGVEQPAQELSGGNQQKVCLAKAFGVEPNLLFVSEPTRGIDVGAKALVLKALRRYNSENGTTIVMVSSELEELRSICDRIAIIDEGRVAGILSPAATAKEFGMLMIGKLKNTDDKVVSHA
ncbi:sugar ABC transporter ATP-binding protein [Candidatus Cryosericum septentrionale]|jgi:simple sugar transport system ATP-binding protein|uniref:Sugar ABC transporter ATP-binding protein n=1 Tax=Candidatus Cryosericum septentrionale TaxID=2290913 RepID=A0A398E4W5_9BACT|nr:sugar ABC transporter ATP-binding protein [Candidatus Cryosericum septentrionale]RIE17661.1 sugar ABC transporter ATP-binding protein [Candidatus Cryosericum septentrionale]